MCIICIIFVVADQLLVFPNVFLLRKNVLRYISFIYNLQGLSTNVECYNVQLHTENITFLVFKSIAFEFI